MSSVSLTVIDNTETTQNNILVLRVVRQSTTKSHVMARQSGDPAEDRFRNLRMSDRLGAVRCECPPYTPQTYLPRTGESQPANERRPVKGCTGAPGEKDGNRADVYTFPREERGVAAYKPGPPAVIVLDFTPLWGSTGIQDRRMLGIRSSQRGRRQVIRTWWSNGII